MEAFSLLKYWRGAADVAAPAGGASDGFANVRSNASSTTTILTAVSHHSLSDTENEDDENNDDGPFFDLEFAVPDQEEGNGGDEREKSEDNDGIIDCVRENNEENGGIIESDDESDGENERELKFTLSLSSSGDSTDPNVSLSPSDDLFFKGRFVPLSEPNCKSRAPGSRFKSATNFRVLLLKLKKSKSNASEKNESGSENPKQQSMKEEKHRHKSQGKFFTIKCKVQEVPIGSLFTRESSSKFENKKTQKQNIEESATDEKRSSKDVMQKYLKKVKPLYVRVSKRYSEKLRLNASGAIKAGLGPSPPYTASKISSPAPKSETASPKITKGPPPNNVKSQRQRSFPARLRVVSKHLVKSRLKSSAVAAAPPGLVASNRRDDSLLQQQDGIQGAIMHCKRSFIASRDLESTGLLRSVCDPSPEI